MTLAAMAVSVLGASAAPIVVDGPGSSIDLSDSTVSDGVRASGGGLLTGTNSTISRSGNNAPVAESSGAGSRVELTDGSLSSTATGRGASTTSLAGRATGGGYMSLTGVDVTSVATTATTYNKSMGLLATGTGTTEDGVVGSRIDASGVTLTVSGNTTAADNANAVRALLGGVINFSGDSKIFTSGNFVYGAFAGLGGTLNSIGSTIETNGNTGVGIYANAGPNGGSVVTLQGDSVTTLGQLSHGIYGARQSGAASRDAGHIAEVSAEAVNVRTSGSGSIGIYADRGSDFTVSGGSLVHTSGADSAGIKVQTANYHGETGPTVVAPASIHVSDTMVVTEGARSHGIHAEGGGTATLGEGVVVATAGSAAHGLYATGRADIEGYDPTSIDPSVVPGTASGITGTGTSVTVSHSSASAVRAENGAQIALEDATVSGVTGGSNNGVVYAATGGQIEIDGGTVTNAAASYGNAVYANGAGSQIGLTDVAVSNSGDGVGTGSLAAGVYAMNGATIQLDGGSVQTSGTRAYALRVAGADSVIDVHNTDVTTTGNNSHAVQAFSSGTDTNLIQLTGGKVSTSGNESWGLYAQRLGAKIVSSADVETTGKAGFGVFAADGGQIDLTGGNITTRGARLGAAGTPGSYGLLAAGSNSIINAPGNVEGESAGISVTTFGADATAVRADTGGEINLNDVFISTAATRSHALHAVDAGSSIAANNADIMTESSGSRAVFAEDGATVTVSKSRINANTTGGLSGAVQANNASIHLIDSALVNHSVNGTATGYGQGVVANGTEGYVLVRNSSVTALGTNASTANPSRAIAAINGGQVELDGAGLLTEGDNAAAIGTQGSLGERVYGTGVTARTTGEQSHGIHLYGASTASPEASTRAEINNITIHTSGADSYGILASRHGAEAVINGFAIRTEGSGSVGVYAERHANVSLSNGTINSSSTGVQIGSDYGAGSTVSMDSVQVAAQGAALRAAFNTANSETATFAIQGTSNLTINNGTLLEVDRSEATAGATGQHVNVTFGSGTVASGNILDTSEHKGANELNITIASGAKVTSNVIDGYNNLTVDGKLERSNTTASLNVGTGQTLNGTGTVAHDVTVDGGSLDTQTKILGRLDLGEANKENLTLPGSGTVTVAAGRQGIVDAIDNANVTVDATAGAAEIADLSAGVVRTGNWGATINAMSGGTVDATAGVARVENFNAGVINMGTGGAAVANFAGGNAVGNSSAADTELTVNNITSGSVSKARVTVANDGTATGESGNVTLSEAQIGGNGVVNASVALESSSINAGNSVGALELLGDLHIDGTSVYEFEINDATGIAGDVNGGWDMVSVAGEIVFDPGATFKLISLDLENVIGEIANFDGYSDYSWILATAVEGISGWEELELDLSAFLNEYSGTFDLSVGQNDSDVFELSLLYTAVPEPTTVALALGGFALLTVAFIRRRSHRVS